jgi:hypothetical protein
VAIAILVVGQLALLAYKSGTDASEGSGKNANIIILLMAGAIGGVASLTAMKIPSDLTDPIPPSSPPQNPPSSPPPNPSAGQANNLDRLKMLGATTRDQALTLALYEVGQGATLAEANLFLRPYTEENEAQQTLRIGPQPEEELLGLFINPDAYSGPPHHQPLSAGPIDLRASLGAQALNEPPDSVQDDLWDSAPAPPSPPDFVIAGVEL